MELSNQALLNIGRASATKLDGRTYTLKFASASGFEWEGLIDCHEWVGNTPYAKKENWWRAEAEYEAPDGHSYVEIGAGPGGADKLCVRDDGMICYQNDADDDNPLGITEITNDFDSFISMLTLSEEE